MRKKLVLLSVLIILSILFTSCEKLNVISVKDGELEEEREEVIGQDVVNIPLKRFSGLDPLKTESMDYYYFSKLIYQSLFEINKDQKVLPQLVADYEILEEGKAIEFELNQGIYWHNGEELSTSDIEFTVKKLKELEEDTIWHGILDAALGGFTGLSISQAIDINVIDSRKAVIVFNKAYGNNLEALTFPILNKDSYGETFEPIGTGPYKFMDYNSSEGVKLEKNNNYWDGEVGIKNVNGKVFDNDRLILKAFQDRRVDIASGNAVDLKEYKKDSNTRMVEYVSPQYEFLAYNFKNKFFSNEEGKQIRKAIYYGIDIQKIIEDVYKGHATQTDTPIQVDSFLANDIERFYGYSLEKATSILKDAGFEDLDKNGVLTNSKGEKLQFKLLTNYSNSRREKMANYIKRDLSEIGIEIILDYPLPELENLDDEKIDQEWENLNRSLSSGNYDLALLGWEISQVPDISFMFHSSYIKEGTNINFYNDRKMDELLFHMYFSGREQRRVVSKELQEYIMEDLPYGSLFFENGALVLDKTIEGPLEPSFYNLYKGIEKCKIVSTKD